MNGNERKMNGNERKMNGNERKMNGSERKTNGNERKMNEKNIKTTRPLKIGYPKNFGVLYCERVYYCLCSSSRSTGFR